MVSDNCKYFKEESITEIIELESNYPYIRNIIGTFACASIDSYKLIETEKAVSYEGQNLSGYNLLVDLNIKGEVEYASQNYREKVCHFPFETIKTISVAVPDNINEVDIESLINEEKFIITPTIEFADTIRLKKDLLQTFTMIFLDVKFI